MGDTICFKIRPGTEYDKAVKKHFNLRPKWNVVYEKVSELLGETITKLSHSVDNLRIDVSELKNEENKKLFNKDGYLKANSKKSKEILTQYKGIIQNCGLSDYVDLGHINFAYGVIRLRGQELESYSTSERDIYYKANFDLEERAKGLVIPISQIEYQEKYLEELKKHETV
jgi:hypothetical protein